MRQPPWLRRSLGGVGVAALATPASDRIRVLRLNSWVAAVGHVTVAAWYLLLGS
jgi:hypothetical protein